MSQIVTTPPPSLTSPVALTKWEKEYRAFQALLPSLLPTQRGQFVAIHDEQVVDSGDDEIALAQRVFAQVGNVPIHMELVTSHPPVARVPHYRLVDKSRR